MAALLLFPPPLLEPPPTLEPVDVAPPLETPPLLLPPVDVCPTLEDPTDPDTPPEEDDDTTTVEDACALELVWTVLLALDVPALLDPTLCPLDTSPEDDPPPELDELLLLLSPSGLGPHASTPANNTAPHPNLRIIMVMVLVTSLLSGDPCVGRLPKGVQTRVQERRRGPTPRTSVWFVRCGGDPSRQL